MGRLHGLLYCMLSTENGTWQSGCSAWRRAHSVAQGCVWWHMEVLLHTSHQLPHATCTSFLPCLRFSPGQLHDVLSTDCTLPGVGRWSGTWVAAAGAADLLLSGVPQSGWSPGVSLARTVQSMHAILAFGGGGRGEGLGRLHVSDGILRRGSCCRSTCEQVRAPPCDMRKWVDRPLQFRIWLHVLFSG
jgi:hypothetical protein